MWKDSIRNTVVIFQPNILRIVGFYTVNNYMQVTGMATGENFAFFIYRNFVEIL